MISITYFEEKLRSHEIETLANALINDAKGFTEVQIHTNLNAFDDVKSLCDWNESCTLASPFRVLDFRSLKERLSEALYFAANYNEIEKNAKTRSHEFYLGAVKGCLESLPTC